MRKIFLLSAFIYLSNLFIVSAQRRSLASRRINPTGISPITWILIGAVFILLVYFAYWIFSKDKKRF